MINVSNKVKVFISSKCDNAEDVQKGRIKYSVMRKALKLLLEETGICEVFAFEKGTATSYNVVNSYMDPLADSDLVVVIVDNKDGITNATLKEVGRVKALNKKCIYVFCDECEKSITELQAELQSNTKNPRFAIVHEFSDIAKEVYAAVIIDVLNIYISYCRGRLVFGEEKNVEENELSENNIETNISDYSDVTKEFISGFPYTKYIVKKEAAMSFDKVENVDKVDNHCASLLGLIIGCGDEIPDFEKIKKDIKNIYKGNLQKLVLLRYEAIENYFAGDVAKCIEKLHYCLDFCDSCKKIPKWMINDIALDLRNIQLDLDMEKDIICFHSEGQQILDKDNEPLYYPVLDRIVSDFKDSIVNYQMRKYTESPYTVYLGGIDYIIDKACTAFIVAYYYGSITQMLMLRNRLYEFLSGVSFEVRNHKIFMFCVKLLILTNEEKRLKQFLNVYGENTNNINDQDVMYLLRSINVLPTLARRTFARQLILKFFGYYYSDEDFERESKEIIDEVKHCIINQYATGLLIKPMFELFEENAYRLPNELILEFIYYVFNTGCKRYYDDAFKFLRKFRVETMSEEQQYKYQAFVIDSVCDEEIRKNCRNVLWAAQNLRQRENITHELLDECIKEKNESFYTNTYLLNTTEHDEVQSWGYIKKYINSINKDNETQGKNGAYAGKVYNPYLTIANIMIGDNIRFNTSQLKIILKSLKGTLLAKNQTIEAKVEALELLCLIQLFHPANRQIKKLVQELMNNWDNVINAADLFLVRGYSAANIDLNFALLRSCFGLLDSMELRLIFMYIQKSEIPEQITVLRTIERLMEQGLFNTCSCEEQNDLFQFVLSESYSSNCDVRFYAMASLIRMMKGAYRKTCLERFVEMMDNETFKGKVGLLYRLKKEDIEDPKIKFIYDKGRIDSHFWVRKVAFEI